jgi:hypothetical protein
MDGQYWDYEQAGWVPSPPVVDLPPQRTGVEVVEEADVPSR